MKAALLLIAGYFVLVPLFLFSLIFYQLNISSGKKTAAVVIAQKPIEIKKNVEEIVVHPIPTIEERVEEVEKPVAETVSSLQQDGRVTILKEFFARYSSPLEEYAQAIVDTADNYGMDWRLLPAIAMQESTLCKKIPKDSYNCWGFGIYGGKVTRFTDYGEAINVITKAIARDYHAYGLKDPSQIVNKYTPANTNNWSANVAFIMERIAPSASL